jgi:hypothetical protein
MSYPPTATRLTSTCPRCGAHNLISEQPTEAGPRRSASTINETAASDAIERIALLLGMAVDPDDPEPALISAVEQAVARLRLLDRARS